MTVNDRLPTFWEWFFKGTGEAPGYARVANRWLIFHFAVGAFLSWIVPLSPATIAEKVLIPLLGIFIGLTFSWAGNAHSLLQSKEVKRLSENRKGGISEYVFTFQLCILVLLLTVTCWVIPGASIEYPFARGFVLINWALTVGLFSLLSLSLRTSWQAVLGANMLLLARVQMLGSKD